MPEYPPCVSCESDMPGPFCLVPVVGVLVVYSGELVVGWSARNAPTELRLIFNYLVGDF